MKLYLDFSAYDGNKPHILGKSDMLALFDDDAPGAPICVASIDEWAEVASDLYAIRGFVERKGRFNTGD